MYFACNALKCVQQRASATTISDGEDEEDDVFEMAEQLPNSSQRQASARPQTAGPGQRAPSSQRPATAPNEPQPRSEHLKAPAWGLKLTITMITSVLWSSDKFLGIWVQCFKSWCFAKQG